MSGGALGEEGIAGQDTVGGGHHGPEPPLAAWARLAC
jgi:hypothetical protein